MELIRKEIFDFVDSWNNHKIRRQSKRPNHPTGRPWMMYFHPPPDVQLYGHPVAAQNLTQLQSDLTEYGMFYYCDFYMFLY